LFKNPDEVLRFISEEDVQFVDVRFCDLPGVMQHFTYPASRFDESVFTEGLAFDGSSVRGFQSIHESDMLLLPDPATARIDPFRAQDPDPQLLRARPVHPGALQPRPAEHRAQGRAVPERTGIADTAFFGAEAEFYIFDSVKFGRSGQRDLLRRSTRRGLVEHRP
jgi:glutamine synthetase